MVPHVKEPVVHDWVHMESAALRIADGRRTADARDLVGLQWIQ